MKIVGFLVLNVACSLSSFASEEGVRPPESAKKIFVRLTDEVLRDKERSDCEKLDEIRRAEVGLLQEKWKASALYSWVCWRDYPCLFGPAARHEIDKLMERLAPEKQRYQRQCQDHMRRGYVEIASGGPSRDAKMESENANTNHNVHVGGNYIHRPQITVPPPPDA